MDPPIINESSFSAANPSSYSLAEIWPLGTDHLSLSANAGGLGLGISRFPLTDDESTLTDQSATPAAAAAKNRKAPVSPPPIITSTTNNNANDLNDWTCKRLKGVGCSEEQGSGSKAEAEASSGSGNKSTEQFKDYIHVRARRGQATDSHSLAERARREKISERMKILQDLVPGCNKVIGKALVLDEIINYIQSLQRQVEFLSLKLEAVNSRMDPTIEGFPTKNLGLPTFDGTGMIYDAQAPREYAQGSQPAWLHMQVGSSFKRAT